MIPDFPNFKKIELEDRKEVEKLTSNFPPYSDFSFFSMWGWDIHEEIRLAVLNSNLVVLFTDYVSGEKFISFLGDTKVVETTQELLDFSKKEYKKDFLKLVPEEMTPQYKGTKFVTKADRDSHDYIYLVDHLINMDKWPKSTCARGIKKFMKLHPNYKVKELPLNSIPSNEYKELFEQWSHNKNTGTVFDSNEYKAFDRFLTAGSNDIKLISIYVEDKLIGFSLYEILKNSDYAVAHFSKGDVKNYSGIFDVLNWEEGRLFKGKGVKYLNWEQDLGIPGLRYSKEKNQPSFLLRKFIVTRES